ncbi:glutamine amidotransferase [candidate division KSB1 bacterium]
MVEEWLQKIFKFTPLQYLEGSISFQSGNAFYVYLTLFAVLLAGIIFIYTVTNIYTNNRTRSLSVALRVSALLLLCLPLFEPVLLTPEVIPNENFLVVLADNSASMSIPDGYYGGTRSNDISVILHDPEQGIVPDLSENFKVRYYTFSGNPERVDTLTTGRPDGDATNLTVALQRILSDFKGLPIAGILMFSDGADNSLDDPLNVAEELRSLDIPLHIVGVGNETFEQERELLDISPSKGLEEGTGAEIDVQVRSWIEETDEVAFKIYRGGEVVFTEKRFLKGGGKIDHFSFFYEPDEKGTTEYSLKIEELTNEINTENNSLNMLIDTKKDTIRVLYFEGHLRSDFKFIKRALEDDQVVEFISVSRTGPTKYYRQGIKSVQELASGFPLTEEELFGFKAVIFGDIEASYFSIEQLEMVERFVRERGGGFLMLGGLNSFADGDFWNTPIADLLPVELDPMRKQVIPTQFYNPDISAEDQGFRFTPTRNGLESPIMKLASDLGGNRALWDEMPPLTSINYLGSVKPGATVLAVKPRDAFGAEEPLMATQRYGRGRSAALATSSTWRWQMMLDAEDTRHERFWRQLVRWLVTSAPDNVNVDLAENLYAPGDEIPIRVTVYDDDYNPLNLVEVSGTITEPGGAEQRIIFHPDLASDGEYIATYFTQKEGVFKIDVEALRSGSMIGESSQSILSRPSKKEYYNATLKRKFLMNLAGESNGLYYDSYNVSELESNLTTRRTSTSVYRTEYLWDMPFIFGLAFLLLAIEWMYRRRRGLP